MATATRPAPAPTLGALTEAVVTILAAMEAQPPGSPALAVYRKALRRKGEEAAGLDVPDALAVLAERAASVTLGLGPSRRAALAEAWGGQPGWKA